MIKLNTAICKFLLGTFIFYATSAKAQTVLTPDTVTHKLYNAQIVGEPNYTKADLGNDTIVEQRLVELALKQPKFDEADAQQKIAQFTLEKQRRVYLNLLSLSLNYNDQTFAKPTSSPTTAYVYPKYFFGVTIPLGLIFNNASDVKITRESARIAHDQELELQQTIRADVLGSYRKYKADSKLLAIQSQITDDAQANFIQVQQKFSDGTATLDAYNDASRKYNDEAVKTINQQLQLDLAKLDVEKYIGKMLEDIFK